MRDNGDILEVPNPGTKNPKEHNIVYYCELDGNFQSVQNLFSCNMIKTLTAIVIDKLAFHEDLHRAAPMRYLFLQMTVESLLGLAKAQNKRSLIINSDIPMMPEVAMEYGFLVMAALSQSDGKFFCQKRLKD